jgi:hypothetical protein
MSNHVDYQEAATEDLAEAWLQAKDKKAVTNASFLIDQLLASVPGQVGVPHGVFRRVSVPPLRSSVASSRRINLCEYTE